MDKKYELLERDRGGSKWDVLVRTDNLDKLVDWITWFVYLTNDRTPDELLKVLKSTIREQIVENGSIYQECRYQEYLAYSAPSDLF